MKVDYGKTKGIENMEGERKKEKKMRNSKNILSMKMKQCMPIAKLTHILAIFI